MSKFTDRFIKVPTINHDSRDDELGLNKWFESYEMILPMQIETYGPTYSKYDDSRTFNVTAVTMKTGQNFLVNKPIAEFEALLNERTA
jgi:hypothetical protein